MKTPKGVLAAVLAVVFAFSLAGPTTAAATTVNLGTADNFAILAGSTITNTGSTVINGDLGLSPGTSVTGFPPGTINGTQHVTDATAAQAQVDLGTAYNVASAQIGGTTISGDIGGQTLVPGLYTSSSSLDITGTLVLDGQGDPSAVFVFQIGSTLTTASGSTISLINSAQACNVFWQVTSSATLGTNSTFVGSILALESITATTGTSIDGRVLARNGAVTLDINSIAKPTCVAPPAPPSSGNNTITVVKQVINDNGGTATYPDFPLFLNGSPVNSGQSISAAPGLYTVTETSNSQYATTFAGDCNASGQINHGGVNTHNSLCIVINNDIGTPLIILPIPPLIDVVKVPNPLALPAGPGSVTYTYTLRNIGIVPVTDITMVGDTCSPLILNSGDVNSDTKLDVSEAWIYTCSTTLSATHTNTVVAHGWANGISATDVASATVVVGVPVIPPLIHITKVPSQLTLPATGGAITYTKTVTNPGTVALSNVSVTDDKCSSVSYISGDTNNDSKLDTTETWTYTCSTNLTKTTVNTATASGTANGLTAKDFAVATVIVAAAAVLPKTGTPPEAIALVGVLILMVHLLLGAWQQRKA